MENKVFIWKRLEFWNLIILVITLGVLSAYTYYTKQILQEAIKTNQISSQPFLVLISEYVEPYKFINNGKGPALNIIIIEKMNGKIMMSSEANISGGLGLNGTGQILRKDFIEADKEKIIQKIPQLKNSDLFERQSNWICLIYEDIFGNKFISVHSGSGNDFSKAIEFKQLR